MKKCTFVRLHCQAATRLATLLYHSRRSIATKICEKGFECTKNDPINRENRCFY